MKPDPNKVQIPSVCDTTHNVSSAVSSKNFMSPHLVGQLGSRESIILGQALPCAEKERLI